MNAAAPSAADRIGAMDGLRGWAALSVVIFHFTWELFGGLYPEFRSFFPALIGNGRLAVAIFFTLSGYVLTIRRWRRNDNPPYYLAALKRYLRLTIPIFVAVMIFYVLMVSGLAPTRQAAAIIDNGFWLGNIADFRPDFLRALFFGLIGAYGFEMRRLYHPFLWTMIVELWGSLIVFGISQSNRWRYAPYAALVILALFFFWLFPLASCFFLGALAALLQRDGVIFRDPPSPLESLIATFVFVAGVVAAVFTHVLSEHFNLATARSLWPAALVGIVVVFSAVRSVPVTRLMTTPLSQALGRLSFPLYLAHGLVAAAVASQLVIWTASFGPIDQLDALLISLTCVLTSLLVAGVLLPVETFTLSLLKRLDLSRRKPKG